MFDRVRSGQMTYVDCTTCRRRIADDDVNVAEGVAFCRHCSRLSRLADIAAEADLDEDPSGEPPSGCAVLQGPESTVIRATCRSVGGAAVLIGMSLFWNGIVGLFVLIAIAGTWHHLIGPVPAWFPAPDSGGDSDELFTSIGGVIFLWIFLTPFMVIGAGMIGGVLTSLWGRTEVRHRGNEGIVFTGIGPIGWRRRFDASKVTRVRLHSKTDSDGDRTDSLLIEADRRRRFGSMLSSDRRAWMLRTLRRELMPAESVRHDRA